MSVFREDKKKRNFLLLLRSCVLPVLQKVSLSSTRRRRQVLQLPPSTVPAAPISKPSLFPAQARGGLPDHPSTASAGKKAKHKRAEASPSRGEPRKEEHAALERSEEHTSELQSHSFIS